MKLALNILDSSKEAVESLARLFAPVVLIPSGLVVLGLASLLFINSDIRLENLEPIESQELVARNGISKPIKKEVTAVVGHEDFEDQFNFKPEHRTYPVSYSFESTSLGFGVKDLDFIQEGSRRESESRVLEMLPRYLRKRAQIYIRPVLILAEKYQVDPLWVLSVMWTESHFTPTAESHVGAQGLMQIMPATRNFLLSSLKNRGITLEVEKAGFDLFLYFPENSPVSPKILKKKLVNIELGVVYLRRLLKMFNYNHRYATVAYNMGPGWTLKRLKENLPVGVKNRYLTKVSTAYQILTSNLGES